MRRWCWSIVFAVALAGCGSEAPAPAPSETAAAVPDVPPVMGPERHILAFGDSLFAGYGVDESQSYPARLEAALRARGINARIANAGVSGDTSAAGLERFAFTLDNQSEPPDLVLLELGGNDLLRQISPDQTRKNLAAMLRELRKRHIAVLLIGLKAPPNLGTDYEQQFDAVYPALAKQYGVPLVPFFLQSVYDKPDLIQADHIHPTAQGIEEIVAATVDQVAGALPKK
jgi:acyl-CoA thioesterase-1